MANTDLYVEYYRFGIGGGRKLYAILYDMQGNALKLDTGTWSLQPYAKVDHADFAMVMNEGAERTGHWSKTIASGIIELPFNSGTDRYTIEIWEESTADVQDRDADSFVFAFTYSYSEIIADQNIAHAQVSYDQTNNRFSVIAWAELNGEVITDLKSMTVTVKDPDDNTVLTLSSNTQGSKGQFYFSETDVSLNPDNVYFMSVDFVDGNDVLHPSACAISTWD